MAPVVLEEDQGTCFVVMGFGKKTDFESGRTLDLNLTYNYIIKPAVMAAGLRCIRADEIKHSGPIDVPMYEQLLNADIVIADLSTSNKNAYYELGVRHALRPYSTIVICEDGIKAFPFDVNHVLIRQYHHMGEGIDYGEVERFRKVLTDVIGSIYEKKPRPHDSPVYTFLKELTPPALAKAMHEVAEAAAKSSPSAGVGSNESAGIQKGRLYSELLEEVEAAQKAGNFEEAKSLLKLLRKRMKPKKPESAGANATSALPQPAEDPYIIQRLAFVTYKAKYDTPEREIVALKEACDLLVELNPETSNDTETLGLWGAVHKRLWEKTEDTVALDKAIRSYERGFYLRNDYYNGINFAFLLNVRAAHLAKLTKSSPGSSDCIQRRAAAIADFVQAQHVREEVTSICEDLLTTNSPPDENTSDAAKTQYLKIKYWVVATRAEAYLGRGRKLDAEAAYADAYSFLPEPWMIKTTQEQRSKLEALLADSPLTYVNARSESDS